MSTLCFSCVDAGNIGVVQSCGAYSGIREPGCSFILWPCTTVRQVSLAVTQVSCQSQCKTQDGVTVGVSVVVTYRIVREQAQAAIFNIEDPHAQITSEVHHSLRSVVASMDVDDAFAAKEKLSGEVEASVRRAMEIYGFRVTGVLITELSPAPPVVEAMNEINKSKRERVVAYERGSADKAMKIKAAEADAEAKRLAGVGTAAMRTALARGAGESMEVLRTGGLAPLEVSTMLLTTQYFDLLNEFAQSGAASIMVPSVGAPSAGGQAPGQFAM